MTRNMRIVWLFAAALALGACGDCSDTGGSLTGDHNNGAPDTGWSDAGPNNGSNNGGTNNGGANNGGANNGQDDVGVDTGPTCVNLECQQVVCPPGEGTTRVSGRVTIPSGEFPLPNVFVYVPNGPLEPIVEGVSCDRCDSMLTGLPLVHTTTDVRGEFVLENVPAGEDIPLVVQVGKWRRQLTLERVEACTDNPITDQDRTRLPKNQSEGDMPKIALTTGGADALECLLRKIGIDEREFTTESGPGRVNFFAGRSGSDRFDASFSTGERFTQARDWWDDLSNLEKYDIVLHSCEGTQDMNNKSVAARQALLDFTELGGRVFLSHWHNGWLQHGPDDFRSVASWSGSRSATSPGHIDTSFEKGSLLADWLVEVGGSTTHAQIPLMGIRHTLGGIDHSLAQRWISLTPGDDRTIQYFSFNTPVGAEDTQQCGRVVFSDIHVSSGDLSTNRPYPTGCRSVGMSPQEKALMFMLFDLSSCIVPDCTPTTCEAEGATCGVIENGCGGSLECGPACCNADGESCTSDDECCGGSWCDEGTCDNRCRNFMERCTENSDCCSNLCSRSGSETEGVCIVN